jgi:hypothetical protein
MRRRESNGDPAMGMEEVQDDCIGSAAIVSIEVLLEDSSDGLTGN